MTLMQARLSAFACIRWLGAESDRGLPFVWTLFGDDLFGSSVPEKGQEEKGDQAVKSNLDRRFKL